MKAIHKQGVVHLDWYLSNFMWKIDSNSGDMVVKIIDFDSAHIIGDPLMDETNIRLQGTRHEIAFSELGEGITDLTNYDISLMNLLRQNKENSELCSRDKSTLDYCFKKLQSSYLANLQFS